MAYTNVTLYVKPTGTDARGAFLTVRDFANAFAHLADSYPEHALMGWDVSRSAFKFYFAEAVEVETVYSATEIAMQDQEAAELRDQEQALRKLFGFPDGDD